MYVKTAVAIVAAVIGTVMFFGNRSVGLVVFLCTVHAVFLITGTLCWKRYTLFEKTVFPAGYLIILILLEAVAHEPLLYPLFVLMYSATFHLRLGRVMLFLLLFSLILTPYYWLPVFAFTSFLSFIFMKARWELSPPFMTSLLVIGLVMLFVLLLPLLFLTLQSTPQTLFLTLGETEFKESLSNTVLSSTVATIIVILFGVPLSYAMVRFKFPGRKMIDSLIDIPILVPQSVVGIAALVLAGPKAPLGIFLEKYGLGVSGTMLGIIFCQVFVSFPFLVRNVMNAFETIPVEMENVSRVLGATPSSTFFRVTLPLALGAVFDGAILSWARAVSEFGSIMIIAPYPRTLSVYTYELFIQYGLKETQPFSILFLIFCVWLFVLLRWTRYRPIFRLTAREVKTNA
ncbi:MAG: ABC transporter permease [bacterium]|nr:ABC transporter permease [bacterium]